MPDLNPLFIIPVVIGVIFILLGMIVKRFPPKKINMIYGYRTSQSMQNQEKWDFAQRYFARESVKFGFCMAGISIAGLVWHPGELVATAISLSLMILIAIFIIYRVEKALRKIPAN
jgi:uncharacterized membrane protein